MLWTTCWCWCWWNKHIWYIIYDAYIFLLCLYFYFAFFCFYFHIIFKRKLYVPNNIDRWKAFLKFLKATNIYNISYNLEIFKYFLWWFYRFLHQKKSRTLRGGTLGGLLCQKQICVKRRKNRQGSPLVTM